MHPPRADVPDEAGGETALPLADALDWDVQKLDKPSACAAKMGIAVRPRKGDALLFFDMVGHGGGGAGPWRGAACTGAVGVGRELWVRGRPRDASVESNALGLLVQRRIT